MLRPDPHPDRLATWAIGVFLVGLAARVLAGVPGATLGIDRALGVGAAVVLLGVGLVMMRYGRVRR